MFSWFCGLWQLPCVVVKNKISGTSPCKMGCGTYPGLSLQLSGFVPRRQTPKPENQGDSRSFTQSLPTPGPQLYADVCSTAPHTKKKSKPGATAQSSARRDQRHPQKSPFYLSALCTALIQPKPSGALLLHACPSTVSASPKFKKHKKSHFGTKFFPFLRDTLSASIGARA